MEVVILPADPMPLSSHILHYLFMLQAFSSYICDYYQTLFCESVSYQGLFSSLKFNFFPTVFFTSRFSMVHSQNYLKIYVPYRVDFLAALDFFFQIFPFLALFL